MSNSTWLNVIIQHECNSCNYKWIQPVEGKKCPQCKSENIKIDKASKHLGPVRI